MPLYIYRCSCGAREEVLLPMAERDKPRIHSCGLLMQRLMTIPAPAQFPDTNRDKVLKTLNREGNYVLPARERDKPRIEHALAKGLNPERKVTGFGF